MSDKNNNLPFGMQSEFVQPGSLRTISQGKLTTFAVGQQKKSRFQKAREEREQKRLQEEQEAASVYESFVASFEVDDSSKTFVRDKVGGGEVYRPSGTSAGHTHGSASSGASRGAPHGSSSGGGGSGSKPRNDMALLLEEMKERDNERSLKRKGGDWGGDRGGERGGGRERAHSGDFSSSSMSSSSQVLDGGRGLSSTSGTGSFDTGDPFTTNLYVGNLAPTTTEERLCEIFGVFGPVNSAKVMWPRTEEERARKRNCGFVSFVHRADAEDALAELNDSSLEGHRMTVGWGKAVKILATPRYTRPTPAPTPPAPSPAPLNDNTTARVDSGSERSNSTHTPSQSASGASSPGLTSIVPSPPIAGIAAATSSSTVVEQMVDNTNTARVVIAVPTCPDQRRLIDTLAQYVAVDGDSLEQSIRSREANNPDYAFLRPVPEVSSETKDLRNYYRWRTLAFVMGSSLENWHDQPFRLVEGGPLWVPPPVPTPSVTTSASQSNDAVMAGSDGKRRRSHSRSRSRSGERYSARRGGSGSRVNRSRSRSRDRNRSRDRDKDNDRRRSRGGRGESERDASEVSSQWQRSGRAGGQSKEEQARERRARFSGMTGAQIERAKAQERGARRARLSQRKYDELTETLATLTLSKDSIRSAMGFVLDNTEAAEDIVNILAGAVLAPAASAPLKVARLYLISDVLHNSGAAVKNASLFRTHIQAIMPKIVTELNHWKRDALGRMSATQFEERVLGVLLVWSDWAIFPPSFLHGLEAMFFCTESDIQRWADCSRKQCQESGGPDSHDDEAVRRQARFAGLVLSTKDDSGGARGTERPVPMDQLRLQLAFVEEFARTRSQLRTVEADVDGTDIDGTALDGHEHVDITQEQGVGMHVRSTNTAESESIFSMLEGVAASSRPVAYPELDDDVDGAPLAEDFDDVDGVPLNI